jgi:hypothetical protein
LTSESPLLDENDRKEYEHFCAQIRIALAPRGALEDALVQDVGDARWFLLRWPKVEAGVLRSLLSDDADSELSQDDTTKVLELLLRYRAAKERTFSRAMRELERCQERRIREVSRPLAERMVRAEDRLRVSRQLVAKQVGRTSPEQIAEATGEPVEELGRPGSISGCDEGSRSINGDKVLEASAYEISRIAPPHT